MTNVRRLTSERRLYYRIVWSDPPVVVDFEPNVNRQVPDYLVSDETRRLQSGISVFRTLAQARRTARHRRPWIGKGFIAELEIPADAETRIERTTKSSGHYTIWADSRDILRWVTQVFPISPEEGP